jgi:hypothetical protein
MDGRPPNTVLEVVTVTAVGTLPGSVIVATPILGLGLLLLAFKSSRNSGVLLAVYSAAYLCGVLGGVALFLVRRSLA